MIKALQRCVLFTLLLSLRAGFLTESGKTRASVILSTEDQTCFQVTQIRIKVSRLLVSRTPSPTIRHLKPFSACRVEEKLLDNVYKSAMLLVMPSSVFGSFIVLRTYSYSFLFLIFLHNVKHPQSKLVSLISYIAAAFHPSLSHFLSGVC